MSKTLYFVLFTVLISYSESSFLKSLPKCSIKDSNCLKQLSEVLGHQLADSGIPELDIPMLDPMHLIDQSVSVIGLVDVSLVDGVVEGVRDCVVESFNTDIEKGVTKFDTLCDVFTIKGIYNVQSAPLIDQLFGNVFSGEGNGSIVLEKLKVNFTNPFNVEKLEDGELYLIPDLEKATYSYDMDKVTFAVDHITFGSQEIAPTVTSFMNRNWKYVMRSFGKFFSDKGFALGHENVKKFFNSVPAKDYITDDLSQYVKNKEISRKCFDL